MDGILFSDNETPLVEEWINPLVGYQALHSITGRILPESQRNEIFTWNAMIEKFLYVAHHFNVDTDEYDIVPIYQSEVDEMKGFIIKMSNLDFLGI